MSTHDDTDNTHDSTEDSSPMGSPTGTGTHADNRLRVQTATNYPPHTAAIAYRVLSDAESARDTAICRGVPPYPSINPPVSAGPSQARYMAFEPYHRHEHTGHQPPPNAGVRLKPLIWLCACRDLPSGGFRRRRRHHADRNPESRRPGSRSLPDCRSDQNPDLRGVRGLTKSPYGTGVGPSEPSDRTMSEFRVRCPVAPWGPSLRPRRRMAVPERRKMCQIARFGGSRR